MLLENCSRLPGVSILVVDDVEEQREIATGMLSKLGYCVASVSNGKEAVEYIKKPYTLEKIGIIVRDELKK